MALEIAVDDLSFFNPRFKEPRALSDLYRESLYDDNVLYIYWGL